MPFPLCRVAGPNTCSVKPRPKAAEGGLFSIASDVLWEARAWYGLALTVSETSELHRATFARFPCITVIIKADDCVRTRYRASNDLAHQNGKEHDYGFVLQQGPLSGASVGRFLLPSRSRNDWCSPSPFADGSESS